jgi:enoyl-CoA hydratase/carnithine racemase
VKALNTKDTKVYKGNPSPKSLASRGLENCAVRLELNNPPLNVIDFAMMDQLVAALAVAEARPEVSVIVLRGSGKTFSVGVDVAVHTPDKVADMLAKFHCGDSRLGDQLEESYDCRRAWPLPGRRGGVGDGLRSGLHR